MLRKRPETVFLERPRGEGVVLLFSSKWSQTLRERKSYTPLVP
jgi:hypothetical protein